MVDSNTAQRIELFRDASSYNSAFNHNASDRMRLMGLGELPPPAHCFICGSGTCEAGYVFTGVWVDYVGNLLICAPCLTQSAELIGCLAPIIKSMMEDHINKLQTYAAGLEVQLEEANERINAYANIVRVTQSVSSDSISSPDPIAQDESEESDGPVISEPDSESEHAESVDESGREDIPDPTAIDKDGFDGLLKL